MKNPVKYKHAKKSALQLLNAMGYKEPPIDPIKIAEELGIHVIFAAFQNEHNKISGFYDAKTDKIYVNKEEFPARQTFTIAHEIGHKVLHQEWLMSNEYVPLYRDNLLNHTTDDPKEKEANFFAANLLVPDYMLKLYSEFANVEQLAIIFVVSKTTIQYRLKNIL